MEEREDSDDIPGPATAVIEPVRDGEGQHHKGRRRKRSGRQQQKHLQLGTALTSQSVSSAMLLTHLLWHRRSPRAHPIHGQRNRRLYHVRDGTRRVWETDAGSERSAGEVGNQPKGFRRAEAGDQPKFVPQRRWKPKGLTENVRETAGLRELQPCHGGKTLQVQRMQPAHRALYNREFCAKA